MKYALAYHAENWLYQNHPRAWGYHKALVYEDDAQRLEALTALVPGEDMEAIRRAYELSVAKGR